MRTLAVDPGSHRTGFSILDVEAGQASYVTSGVIVLEPSQSLPDRLKMLAQDLKEVCEKYCPKHLAVETVFFAKNAQSALKLGQARGIVLLTAAQFNLEIFEYSPTAVKSSVCGSGRAEKSQIEHMARILLRLPANFQFASSDHSDALAIGLTHLQLWTSQRRIPNDSTTSRPTRS